MARRFTLELIMDLATKIGVNPAKLASRGNVSFLGTGPQKNPLFQRHLPGLDRASPANLGSRDALIEATEDAASWAKDGKLNSIQMEILGRNLSGINKILNPPPLPMASVSQLPTRGTGIAGIKQRMENIKGMSDKLGQMEKERLAIYGKDKIPSQLPEPGPEDIAAFKGALDMQTGMSRAIARQLLLKDTRLNLPDDVLNNLRTGSRGEDPLDLMAKYYGRSMEKYDDFLNSVNLDAARPEEFAEMILKNVKLIPAFAEGGRIGFAEGTGQFVDRKLPSSNMPVIDPYEIFFRYQNKLMRNKKREGLARILEV